MSSTIIQGLLLGIMICFSSANMLLDYKTHSMLKTTLALMPLLEYSYTNIYVDAVPPPEVVANLKAKIEKGMNLLKELNSNLGKIKTHLTEKKDVDKDILDRIVDIKNDFKRLQVDPGDLPQDLIDKFKEKTLESFKLIIENYEFDKTKPKKLPVKKEEEGEIQAEEGEIKTKEGEIKTKEGEIKTEEGEIKTEEVVKAETEIKEEVHIKEEGEIKGEGYVGKKVNEEISNRIDRKFEKEL